MTGHRGPRWFPHPALAYIAGRWSHVPGLLVEPDPGRWGRRCKQCGIARAIVAFGSGYRLADHADCESCASSSGPYALARPRLRLGDDIRLTEEAATVLAGGAKAIRGLVWWHTSPHTTDFDPDLVHHVGHRQAALHRLVSHDIASAAHVAAHHGSGGAPIPHYLAQAVTRHLYELRLDPGVTILGPVIVESGNAAISTAPGGIAPGNGEVQPYVNAEEAPGTLSLILGPRTIAHWRRVEQWQADVHVVGGRPFAVVR